MTQTAKEYHLATQMGTQIHATDNYRRVVEVIQSGAIGSVTDVQVWVNKDWGGGERPTDMPAVPAEVDWDLWLGPAPKRPYSPVYLPAEWRRWWDFGNGTLGDMGCHYIDLIFWALELRHPTTIEASGPAVHAETCPRGMKVTWEFPARGQLSAVKVTWTDGNMTETKHDGHEFPGAGIYFKGTKGSMFADYGGYRLFPEETYKEFKAPEPTIPASVGHHQEWINACKTGSKTLCNFDYSGALTESVLLGMVAFRAGQKLEWDGLKIRNSDKAQGLLKREYRPGWEM
jgi:predicted dehydrogenase